MLSPRKIINSLQILLSIPSKVIYAQCSQSNKLEFVALKDNYYIILPIMISSRYVPSLSLISFSISFIKILLQIPIYLLFIIIPASPQPYAHSLTPFLDR